jgi:hypothetical protein
MQTVLKEPLLLASKFLIFLLGSDKSAIFTLL